MADEIRFDPPRTEYLKIAPIEALPPGERMFVEVNGKGMVIFNLAGTFYAILDLCTHDDGPLGNGELEGFKIICPRHGARFDIRTGRALSLPAVRDVPAFPVRVREGMIELGIPRK